MIASSFPEGKEFLLKESITFRGDEGKRKRKKKKQKPPVSEIFRGSSPVYRVVDYFPVRTEGGSQRPEGINGR